MGFLLTCDNKGCGKSQEGVLEKETNQVFCVECGEVIKSVTDFTKKAMLGMGQIRRTNAVQKAFPIKCVGCLKVEQPKLDKGKLVCPKCQAEHTNLQPAYAHVVKQYLMSPASK